MKLPRKWPGIARSAWPALNRLARACESALSPRSDGSMVIRTGAGGPFMYVPQPGFLAVITAGSNPYSWRMLQRQSDGGVDVVFAVEGTTDGQAGPDSSDDTWGSGTDDPRFRPAYERFGNKDVLPGTVVWIEPTGYIETGNQEQEFSFWHRDGPVAAKANSSGAPTVTLNGGISDSATSITISPNWSGMPYRKSFRLKIDDEVIEVTQDTTSNTVTVTRAQDGTTAASHTSGASCKLCDAYDWTEERAPQSGNDEWEDRPEPLSGTFLLEPARERNQACAVPDGQFVLVRRKGRDGEGSSTIMGSDLGQGDTTVNVADRSSFPQRTPFCVRVDGEFMHVTAGAGSGAGAFTVSRGEYLSPATRHESGNEIVEAICEWTFDWCCGQSSVQNIINNQGGSGGKLYTFGFGNIGAQTIGAGATTKLGLGSISWAKPLGLTYASSTTEVRFPLSGWWMVNYQLDGDYTFGEASSELPFCVDSDGAVNDVDVNGLHDCQTCGHLVFEEGHDGSGSSEQSETADFSCVCLQGHRQVFVNKGDLLSVSVTNPSDTDALTINESWIDGFFIGSG